MSLALCFEDRKHHGIVVVIVLYQPENVSKSVNQAVPTDMDRLSWLFDPPDVGQRWFLMVTLRHKWDAGTRCFTLTVHVSPLTSLVCSMDQHVGWVCLTGTQEKNL